jgi:pimeloyl-ACP methyl ester carboxylesterase
VTAAVVKALPALPDGRTVILVGHSNAGCFVPVIADALRNRVASCVFVDAALPSPDGSTPVAPAEFLPFLESLAVNGLLPPWTEWWDTDDIAPMFPNGKVRRDVTAEQPRLPIEYYRQTVPVPATWREMRCAYLAFSSAYDEEIATAGAWGWPTERLPGEHLHQLVDPVAVTNCILRLAKSASGDGPAGRHSG